MIIGYLLCSENLNQVKQLTILVLFGGILLALLVKAGCLKGLATTSIQRRQRLRHPADDVIPVS